MERTRLKCKVKRKKKCSTCHNLLVLLYQRDQGPQDPGPQALSQCSCQRPWDCTHWGTCPGRS